MKEMYSLACGVLAVTALFLAVLNIRYAPPPPERLVQENAALRELVAAPAPARGDAPENLAPIWERNLFSPDRGGSAGAASGTSSSEVELAGIMRVGGVRGALFLERSAATAPAPGAKPSPRFFMAGQKLPNGAVLKEVLEDRVVLSRRGEDVVLRLEWSDAESRQRAGAAAAAAAATAKPAAADTGTERPAAVATIGRPADGKLRQAEPGAGAAAEKPKTRPGKTRISGFTRSGEGERERAATGTGSEAARLLPALRLRSEAPVPVAPAAQDGQGGK